MVMRKIIYVATLAFLCIVGLSGCSTVTTSSSSAKYTSNYRAYQTPNLPADYPTKYLPNGNLWDDFRKNMQLPVNTSNRRIQEQIRWIQAHQDFINRSLTRGAQYFYYIYQQTKIRHLPAELSLIPVYESGYVPVGRSNKGAVGLWQFMPGTAAGYGMRMDHWFDGRRDLISSTNSAMKYFSYLHYFFNDWLLAIAAYDHGVGNVQGAILRNQRKGLRTDFWSLTVPRETHVYVPQLLALAAVIKNPAKYGVHLVPINNGPYFEQINVGKAIDINKYAKASGIEVSLMRSLNAGYLRTMMDPDGPYTLLVPRGKVNAFKAKLSGRGEAPTESVSVPEQSQVQPQAQQQQTQVTMPVSRVMSKQQNKVFSEEPLAKLSSSQTQDDDSDNSISKSNSEGSENEDSLTTTVNTIPYKVAKGDTVYSIARKFKVSPNKIKSFNKLSGNNVKVGKIIKIPHVFRSSSPTPKTSVKSAAKTNIKSSATVKRVSAAQTKGNITPKSKFKSKSNAIIISSAKSTAKTKVSVDVGSKRIKQSAKVLSKAAQNKAVAVKASTTKKTAEQAKSAKNLASKSKSISKPKAAGISNNKSKKNNKKANK